MDAVTACCSVNILFANVPFFSVSEFIKRFPGEQILAWDGVFGIAGVVRSISSVKDSLNLALSTAKYLSVRVIVSSGTWLWFKKVLYFKRYLMTERIEEISYDFALYGKWLSVYLEIIYYSYRHGALLRIILYIWRI